MATYRRLLANSRLKMDVNEKIWRPFGYVTMALTGGSIILGIAVIVLSSFLAGQIAELQHVGSITTIRQLRGGYIIWEDATGRYLAIPNAILDSDMRSCRNPSYQCIRVKRL